MALLFMDSFDHYATADLLEKWTTSGSAGTGASVAIQAAGGRRSSASFRYTTGTTVTVGAIGYVTATLSPTDATVVLGFAFQSSANPAGTAGCALASIRDGASAQMTLRLNSDYTLSVMRGTLAGGTVLGTTSAALSAGIAAYLEWKVLISNTVGTVDVRINGASVLALTTQDTQNTANASYTGIALGMIEGVGSSLSGTSRTLDYDDLYVLDGTGAAPWNTFLGDVRVDVRNPTGAGAVTGWTPSTGANWQNVDDVAPNDDTDYNTAASSGLTDTFVCQDAPVAGAAIYGVQVNLSAKKTDAGTCSLAPVVRQSGSNLSGTAQNPSTSYAYLRTVYQTNPHTSAQWTEADFNADEFGYTRTA